MQRVSDTLRGELEPEHLDRHFTPWGFGLHHDRFLELRRHWDFAYWDRGLNERIRGTRSGVFPATSKVRDIGELDGVNPPEEWRARNETFSGSSAQVRFR